MSNIITIIKKELTSYFNQPMAYILLVVFLVINNFFYFKTVLLSGQSSIRPMFDLLPWILLFFVPAITMGLIAKEKESGTLEILVTQSIKPSQIILGKFFSGLIFVALGVLITLIIPISLSSFGDFDLGVIFSQYLCSIFLITSFVAIGLFASSLTKNQIVSFILGITFNFILILIGFEIVVLSLPSSLAGFLQKLSILDHYYSLGRGVLDIKDLIYFVFIIIVFVFATIFLFTKDKVKKIKLGFKFNPKIVLIVLIILMILINLWSGFLRVRIDLTQNKIFTLSKATKNIIKKLEKEIALDFFVSKELPVQIANQSQDIKDILKDYEKYSQGKIKLDIHYPDVNEQDKSKAQELGIPPLQFNVVAQDEFQIKQGYLGLAVSVVLGKSENSQESENSATPSPVIETIPFIERTDNLEYQLTSLIWQLTNEYKKKIIFLTGHGEKSLYQDLQKFNQELSKQYDVQEFNLVQKGEEGKKDVSLGFKTKANPVPENTSVIVLAGPSQKIDVQEIEKIKEFLSKGGSAFLTVKQIEINPQFMSATSTQSNLNEIISDLGIKVENNLVYDLKSHETISLGQGVINYILPYPLWPRVLAHENNIVKDVKSIFLPWPSEISLVSGKSLVEELTINKLFSTTDAAGAQTTDNLNIDPQQKFLTNDLKNRLMVVAVEKHVKSQQNQDNEAVDSRLIVIGNSDFITDQFVQNTPENLIFALNSIEWLTQDEILSSIRTKNLTSGPLIFKNNNQKKFVKYGNIIGLPALVALMGVGIMLRRRRISQREFGED